MTQEDPRYKNEKIAVLDVPNKILNDQKQVRQTGKFPKSARLLTSSHYKLLHRTSSRTLGHQIAIDFRQGRSSFPRLGITVSRKFGKAHDRNRFKRVVREAFRELCSSLPQDLELNVSPRNPSVQLTKQAILIDLKNLLLKLTHE